MHEVKHLTKTFLNELDKRRSSPCISVYVPTHRQHPANQGDVLSFRVLVKQLEESLQKYPAKDVSKIIKSFNTLGEDKNFWDNNLEGLVILATSEIFYPIRISKEVSPLVIVGDSFHTHPLQRYLQTTDRFHVLAINQHHIRLFEGDRYHLDEVKLDNDILSIAANVVDENDVKFDGDREKRSGDIDKFFYEVDRAICDRYSRPMELPLILSTLAEHHKRFKKISHNPYLLNNGINLNPDTIAIQALQKKAWEVMSLQYLTKLVDLSEEFDLANSNHVGSDDLQEIAEATAAGRVATLMIEADRLISGRFDARTGELELHPEEINEVDDLLDDLGRVVEKKKGKVWVVPAWQMPSNTGVAAIYRY
jgi:hypothetical protein